MLECAPELRGFYEQEGFEQHGGAKVYHDQPRMGESEVTLVTLIWMPSSGLPDEKDGEESGESEEYDPKKRITKGGMVFIRSNRINMAFFVERIPGLIAPK